MRPIGNLALLCLGLQVIEMGPFASYRTAAGISTAHSCVIPGVWGHVAGRGVNPDETKFIDDNLKELLRS